MAHAIWNGAVNFGLVMIPVKLYTAVRDHSLHFNLLHGADMGRIHNVRRCEVCGKEVEWKDLVRGFPYEKGHYVAITDEDLKRANVEATQSVDIVAFVDREQIDPMLYDTPYYLAPEKKGRHAYALLRDALAESGKVGIAKVVIRTREHLAALEPHGDALVLELMHFADEISGDSGLEIPHGEKPTASEMKVARMLIDTMSTSRFDPTEFKDKYTDDLMKLIEARAHDKPLPKGRAKAPMPSRVVDLMDVLQKSLRAANKTGPSVTKTHHRPSHRPHHARKAS
jgi:DNA end-binding protein Ku